MRTDSIQIPLSIFLTAVFCLMLGIDPVLGAPIPGSDVTYTSDADFDKGTLMNLNHNDVHDQLQLSQMTTPFPFINIANSGRGTIVRVDVNTGTILGEYYTSPDGMGKDPSRTTVDQFGNVWVSNRAESGVSGGVNKGSITRVGLIIGGTRANADGSENPTGQYLKPPFQYNTCIDRDGDGLIKTSRAADNMLSWSNAGGADTNGGVSTAEDECVINYTRVVATNTRTIAVDANNDVWVGGANTAHEKVNGVTGEPVPGTQFNLGCGGYGGLIDKNGVLWSARFGSGLLRFDTKTMTGACLGNGMGDYGLGIDPNTGEIWHVFLEGNRVAKLAADGTLLGIYNHGEYYAQGVVVDKSGNVWVAHSVLGPSSSVGHLRTDGTFVGNVSVGSGPTGVSVDANGKVWSSNYYSWNASRIDPNAGAVGGGGFKIGAVDMTVSLGSNAYPYNYSDMTGYVAIGGTSPQGAWTVVQDSGVAGNTWGTIIWNKESQGSMPSGTIILVQARAADTEAGLSSKSFIAVSNSQGFSLTGRYIEVRVTLKPNNSGDKPVLSDLRISVAPLSNVRVIDTISSADIVINTGSFTYQPYSITYGSTTSVIEWRFDAFAIGQMNDLSYTVTMRNPVPGEDRLVDHKLEILYTDSNGNSVRNEIGPLSVHVLSSILDTSLFIDKSQYQAQSDVGINVQMENRSSAVWSGTVDVLIEDVTGNVVSHAATSTVNDLEPLGLSGWAYHIPISVTASQVMTDAVAEVNVDFASIMQTLGIEGKTMDKNSIRVLEHDAMGNILKESQAQATFTSDTLATIAWLLQGTTTKGTTRHFFIYFDTTDHNLKAPSLNTTLPPPVRLIAYSDDIGRVFVAESNGDGTFGTARLITDVTPATDNTWGVVLDDFNNDGFADIITGSGATGDIYYLQNKADRSNNFNSGIKIGTINASAYIMGIAAADFDNDGNKDFVVSGNNNILYLFRGRGDGTFTQTTLVSPPGAPLLRGKAIGDVDKDGKLDLVVSSYDNGLIYFYKGNGDGTFASPIQIGANGRDPYGLLVGDFDENGVIDIIQSADVNGNAYLFKGHGDGTFETLALVPSLNLQDYTAFTTRDFNSDGHLDVIAVTLYNHTLEFYPGKGDGTFGPKSMVGTTPSYSLGISSSPALSEVLPVMGLPEAVPSQTFNFIWNTGTTLAGNYQVHAVWSDGTKTVSEKLASFAILPDMSTAAKIVTDKASYSPNENATLTSTVTNKSVNYVMENLTAKISILNPVDSSQLYTETKPILTLMLGASFTFKSYWNTGTYPPGAYPVTLEVRDASGAVLTMATQNLIITSSTMNPSTALRGQITVDKQSVLQGEPIAVAYSVTNSGNMDLTGIALTIHTVHVVEQTVYDTIMDQTSLLTGETFTNTGQINTQTYSAKDYLVVLRANINGTENTLAGTYFRIEGAPSVPSLSLPAAGSDIETFTPTLVVNNASDPNDDKLTYEYEVYDESGLTNLIVASGPIPEMNGVTSWTVSLPLTENHTYYWRCRAYDGKLYSVWMVPASFRVNTVNDPPTAPVPTSPADNGVVDTMTPVLVVNNASDPDSVSITYNFDIAFDTDFTQIVASTTGVFEGTGITSWQVPANLNENTTYYWRAQADDWFITGSWSAIASFFVNTANDAPTVPTIITPENNAEVTTLSTDIVLLNSTDPDSPVLTYFFEVDTVKSFDSTGVIRSAGIAAGQGTTTWIVTGLRDNTLYYVRAKASDGQTDSGWSEISAFFVNTVNDAPTAPVLANPSNGAGVSTFTPVLSVHNSTDPDRDVLSYEFELFGDAAMTNLLTSAAGIIETPQITSWTVPVTLEENRTYYWQSRAFDGEANSGWMPSASFMVNTANDAPGAPTLYAPTEGSSVATLVPMLAITNAVDPDSDSISYDFEVYAGDVLVQSITNIPQNGSGITSITLISPLPDNTTYRWRARAYDGDRYGAWMAMATFSIHIPVNTINATINFDPNTLNKKSNGNWVTVYIELPAGYNITDISIPSLRIEGTISAELRPYAIGDQDKDGIPDLMVKFKRADAINLLPNGEQVTVKVTGKVGTVTFDGVDVIRVLK